MTWRGFSFLGLALLVAAFAASGVLFLPIPFTRDQGIYSYMAWCWLGEWWPYQYAFEHKGPWLYLTYAIFLKLSKGANWGPNLADLLARTATVILVFLFALRAFDARKALLASLFAAVPLLCVFSSCWWGGQAETFMMPLAAAAALSAFESAKAAGKRAVLFAAVSGAALSQLLMFKPSAAWLVIGLAGFLAAYHKRRLRALAAFSLALAAGIGFWSIYFLGRGIGREFFEYVILFNWFHLQGHRLPAAALAKMAGKDFRIIFGPGIIILAAGAWTALRKRTEPAVALALIWLAAALVEIFSQTRFFLYHMLVVIPPAAVVMAIGADAAGFRRARAWKWAAALAAITWVVISFRFYALTQTHYQTAGYLRGKISYAQYLARFQEPGKGLKKDFNAYADAVAANRVRQLTTPGDYVLVFGYEPLINYLAARRAPSRFHSDYPLSFPPKSALAARMQIKWRDIFLAELKARKPKLVILAHNDINALEPADSSDQARRFKDFWDWLNLNYRQGERIEDFEFWEQKN